MSVRTHTITDLYEEYLEHRNISLSYEQFTSLVTSFPVLLIISTDGKVDSKEWNYLKKRADDLAEIFLKDVTDIEIITDFKSLLLNEFKYLLMHFDTWERKFMKS